MDPKPVIHHVPRESPARLAKGCGPVVVTVSVVGPLPVTLAGLKLQELSLGKPVQDVAAKLMVPVYPV